MKPFSAKIYIIGVNPYVLLPAAVLKSVFKEAGKDRGPIPVSGTINNHPFTQTLVKYAGKWRLYLNMPMRKGSGSDVGDTVVVALKHDPAERTTPVHPKFDAALKKNKAAKNSFEVLPPSRQKEILRYINSLKSDEAIERNITRAIGFLQGKERFVGRDKP